MPFVPESIVPVSFEIFLFVECRKGKSNINDEKGKEVFGDQRYAVLKRGFDRSKRRALGAMMGSRIKY